MERTAVRGRLTWQVATVPLRAILRHRQRSGSDVPVRLLYSSRTLADVTYHGELDQYRDRA